MVQVVHVAALIMVVLTEVILMLVGIGYAIVGRAIGLGTQHMATDLTMIYC